MSITPKQSDWSPKYTELRDANGVLQQRTVQHTPDGPIEILYPPQEKEQRCFCGDIYRLGVIHRDDGPCHYPDNKEPEKEPVAFPDAPQTIYLQVGDECPDDAKWKELIDVCWCDKQVFDNDIVYVRADTTPSQRKPLTRGQIREIEVDVSLNQSFDYITPAEQLCRAIEAAHGIKENT